MAAKYKYLTPTNWHKYQAVQTSGVGVLWIKDYVDKEADKDYVELTALQRYVFDGILRLRGRLARNIDNDPTYVARALQMLHRDRTHVAQAIRTLCTHGLLTLSNQRGSDQEESREEEKREESSRRGRKVTRINAPEEEVDELA